MAVQFERTTNLEEIDSDALFGIEYLAHQTLGQKIILWGNVIIAAFSFILMDMFMHSPFIVTFAVMFVFLTFGVLFGANQSENLTIGGYLKLVFFKPSKHVNFESTEDVSTMKDEAELIKAESAVLEKRENAVTPEGQRRSLIIVIVLIIVVLLFAIGLFSLKSYRVNNAPEHHTVGVMMTNITNVGR